MVLFVVEFYRKNHKKNIPKAQMSLETSNESHVSFEE